jgi:hypothetical protein
MNYEIKEETKDGKNGGLKLEKIFVIQQKN